MCIHLPMDKRCVYSLANGQALCVFTCQWTSVVCIHLLMDKCCVYSLADRQVLCRNAFPFHLTVKIRLKGFCRLKYILIALQ